MKNTNKDALDESYDKKNGTDSLEDDLIKALVERNEEIKDGRNSDFENQDKKEKKSSGFDEWSVSWP